MSTKTKKKESNVCETCLDLFDDYSVGWVQRDGYYSQHCVGCIEKHDLPLVRMVKEKKIKETKNNYKKLKKS